MWPRGMGRSRSDGGVLKVVASGKQARWQGRKVEEIDLEEKSERGKTTFVPFLQSHHNQFCQTLILSYVCSGHFGTKLEPSKPK